MKRIGNDYTLYEQWSSDTETILWIRYNKNRLICCMCLRQIGSIRGLGMILFIHRKIFVFPFCNTVHIRRIYQNQNHLSNLKLLNYFILLYMDSSDRVFHFNFIFVILNNVEYKRTWPRRIRSFWNKMK